jgi:hypothetical protein
MDKRERGMHVYSSWIKREANEKKETIIHRVFEVDHKCIYKG